MLSTPWIASANWCWWVEPERKQSEHPPSRRLGLLPLRLTQVPLALGLPPGDSAFRDLVNLTLQAMKAGGQLDGLYGAWFADGPLPLEMWPGAPYRSLRLEVNPQEPDAQG